MDSIRILIPILGISIPILAILYAFFDKWMDLKERQLETQSRETAERTAQYAAQTERLEQRVRVLERIITDSGFSTATEIDRLRDESLN
ncbi:MAG: hypothetical protein RL367_2306 [Pseudomonadota bacterium]|jgi:hypothetical protein